jgi:integrase
VLAGVLCHHRICSSPASSETLVFPTRLGGERNKDNLRWRILRPALARADQLLERRGRPPLPAGLSTHGLRHTYASILVAVGEDPVSVMVQLGHPDPGFSFRVYSHMMRCDPGERVRLRALVAGQMGRVEGSRLRRYRFARGLRRSLGRLRARGPARAG